MIPTASIVNRVAWGPPPPGYTMTFHQAGGEVRLSLEELDRLARRAAVYLARRGIGAGDRIGICAKNRLEWALLDLAALKLRAITAGFEAGKVAPTPKLADRYQLRILYTDQPTHGSTTVAPIGEFLPAIASMDEADDRPQPLYEPGDITTIKFTSGSTAEPKGLAATVGSIDSSLCAVQALFNHGSADKLFVFLPLSLLQQRYWIYSALAFGHDLVVTSYERAFYALEHEQPTVVMGVPAFFEVVRHDVESRVRRELEKEAAAAAALRRACLHKLLGTNIRYLWTGSAPASSDLLSFFASCGMAIYEGYGLNETCIVSKNAPGAHKLGSVGRPLPGKHVTIDPDGVVIVRSGFPVNTRYLYSAPGESERVFLSDGAVRTGDLGRIDEDGFLYILGRADDLVVLENGRNVQVRPIEESLRRCPAITECIVVGVRGDRLVAVMSADASAGGRRAIERHIADINVGRASEERLAGFIIADEPFSIENGLLTSQFKPRRRAIFSRYEGKIRAAYGEV